MVVGSSTVTPAPARTAEPQQTKLISDGTGAQSASPIGNGKPAGGQILPPSPPVELADIARAAESLQQQAREASRNLEFRVDNFSGRTVITVINKATDEVVRQIPAEEALALARSLDAFGSIVDAKA